MTTSITELSGNMNMKDFLAQNKQDCDDVTRSVGDLTQSAGKGHSASRDFGHTRHETDSDVEDVEVEPATKRPKENSITSSQ